jgi:hypothetical protein
MVETDVTFSYSIEQDPSSGKQVLFFGKNRVSEGYPLCEIAPVAGSDEILGMIQEALNECPSLMHEIDQLQRDKEELQQRIAALEGKNPLKAVS